jgi:hypothetical protein
MLSAAVWRKSSHSNPSGDCVETARLSSGGMAVRNSRFPDGPALLFTSAEWDAFVKGALDGEFGWPGDERKAAESVSAATRRKRPHPTTSDRDHP